VKAVAKHLHGSEQKPVMAFFAARISPFGQKTVAIRVFIEIGNYINHSLLSFDVLSDGSRLVLRPSAGVAKWLLPSCATTSTLSQPGTGQFATWFSHV
jgi:hypothetical protein